MLLKIKLKLNIMIENQVNEDHTLLMYKPEVTIL